ncbi:MAG: hypothetical protein ACK4PI_11445 [Tepidisphaerales bacterium]
MLCAKSLLVGAVGMVCLWGGSVWAADIRAFHIGNSVTDTIRYTALRAMVQANPGRGHTYTFGRHTIPGAPLQFIWDNPTGGFAEPSSYQTALPGNDWNVLTLQPFDRSLASDLDYAQRFIDLMRTRPTNVDAQVYVYSRWPRRASIPFSAPTQWSPINYPTVWAQPHVVGSFAFNNFENDDFFDRLLNGLRDQNTAVGPEILMVPVGDVLLEIDTRLRNGQIRGITGNTLPTRTPGVLDVNILYPDGIHFGNLGNFIVGTTFYAVMFKDDPRGLVVPNAYKQAADNPAYRTADFNFPGLVLNPSLPSITEETIFDLQDAIWHVVLNHPAAGIPEPTALGVLVPSGALAVRRRR